MEDLGKKKVIAISDVLKFLSILDKAYQFHEIRIPNDPNYHEANRRRSEVQKTRDRIQQKYRYLSPDKGISERIKNGFSVYSSNILSQEDIEFLEFRLLLTDSGTSRKYSLILEYQVSQSYEIELGFNFTEEELDYIRKLPKSS